MAINNEELALLALKIKDMPLNVYGTRYSNDPSIELSLNQWHYLRGTYEVPLRVPILLSEILIPDEIWKEIMTHLPAKQGIYLL